MQLPGYIGDVRISKTLRFVFQTDVGGVPTTLSGGTVSVYKDASLSQSVTGVTLTADYDGLTGLNHVAIDLSADGSFYSAASDFMVVLTAGTVGGANVFPLLLAQFSIENRSALMPTTADRKLDVSAGGEAGLDWANIGGPTTAQNLSGTNIDVDQVVASVSGAVGSVTGAVGSVASGGITAASIATGAIDADALAADAVAEIADGVWDEDATAHQTQGTFGQAIGDPVADANTIYKAVVTDAAGATVGVDVVAVKAETASLQTDTNDIQTRLPAALVGGRIDATVDGTGMEAAAVAAIADGVWDEAIAGHLGAGATGAALNAAGSAGDPWTTPLPGAYGAGTAGKIIGDNVNATIGSRASQTSVDDIPTTAELTTAVDALPTAVENAAALLVAAAADPIAANMEEVNAVALQGIGTAGNPWRPV